MDEVLQVQGVNDPQERRDRIHAAMDMVNMRVQYLQRYPHEFSGGQRQRIGIARALAVEPKLIVCDEAVSALDVSVQAQVVNLLQDLQRQLGLSFLFIAHDLAVVKHIADRVAVMYLGRIVEIADKKSLFEAPRHPYTARLMSPTPSEHGTLAALAPVPGSLPDLRRADLPACRFAQRCERASARCHAERPRLDPSLAHPVACWHPLAAPARAEKEREDD